MLRRIFSLVIKEFIHLRNDWWLPAFMLLGGASELLLVGWATPWDGKFKGKLQPAGTYVYYLVIQRPLMDDERIIYHTMILYNHSAFYFTRCWNITTSQNTHITLRGMELSNKVTSFKTFIFMKFKKFIVTFRFNMLVANYIHNLCDWMKCG